MRKEDKSMSVYEKARSKFDWTREQALQKFDVQMTVDQLEKLENGRTAMQPHHVMTMAKAYNEPELCNHYCTHECPIGREFVHEIHFKDLSNIVLEILGSLQDIEDAKDRLIEIASDDSISGEELQDFNSILLQLESISTTVDALKLWAKKNLPQKNND